MDILRRKACQNFWEFFSDAKAVGTHSYQGFKESIEDVIVDVIVVWIVDWHQQPLITFKKKMCQSFVTIENS